MSKQEKLGSDGYSRKAFEKGLEELEGAGFPYQPPSLDRKTDEDWTELYGAANAEERAIIQRLDQMYANAHREANEENAARDLLELLPLLEERENAIDAILARFGGDPPAHITLLADGLRGRIRKAEELSKERPVAQNIATLTDIIESLIEGFAEFMRSANDLLLGKDRFGRDRGEAETA